MAVVLEAQTMHYVPLLAISDMFFVFGTCKLVATLADDVGNNFQSLNEQREINKNICKIIEMHSTIKQLSGAKITALYN